MSVKSIGVMGGMFDPIHTGHIAIALRALKDLQLDHVRLVPCHIPNHRAGANVSVQDRLAMLQLVANDVSCLVVDDRECMRDEVSYTVNTLESLCAQFPDDRLVFILGWDAFCSLPSWHRWLDLFDFAHLAVMRRGGANALVPPELQAELLAREVTDSAALGLADVGKIVILEGVCSNASSTEVRQKVQSSESTQDLLNRQVAEFIRQNNLYL